MSQYIRLSEFFFKILVLNICTSIAMLSQKLNFTNLKIFEDSSRGERDREVFSKYKAFSIDSAISDVDIQFHLLNNREEHNLT